MKTRRQKIRRILLIILFLFFPATFYYFSPYLIIDGTINGIVSGSFILFFLMFVSSLLLGRAFCGWVCPAGGAQDFIMQVNNRDVKKRKYIKWIIWIPWIISIIALAVKNGGYQKIDPFYQTTFGLSIGNVYALITYLLVLSLIAVPALLVGKRSFCHHICWMAPFMILGRKISNLIRIPSLKLTSFPGKCTNCHTCTTHCPMSLPVEEMVKINKMENQDCILCGSCVDGCKSKAIKFDFGQKSNK